MSNSSFDVSSVYYSMNQLDVQKVYETVELLENDTTNTLTSNACQNINIKDLVIDRDAIDKVDYSFSKSLEDINPVNQKSAGVCWICGGMTMCRRKLIKKLNLDDDFNLSINYLFFWDKLEKCNYFMDYLLKHFDQGYQSEIIKEALTSPCSDGGHWNYFVDLVKKYGMIPESICKRKYSGKNTSHLNTLLVYKLREFAADLFNNGKNGQKLKGKYLTVIIKIMVRTIGKPIFPNQTFDWIYCDKKGTKKIINKLTPLLFYNDYCELNFDNFVHIINDPRIDHPFYKTYIRGDTFNTLGMSKACKITDSEIDVKPMLNLPNDDIVNLIKKQIDRGIPVWFTCDVGKYVNHAHNIMDANIYDYDTPFDTSFMKMSKENRMDFCDTYGSHVMAIVGYDMCESDMSVKKRKYDSISKKITKFKVENSWGVDGKNKGFYVMDIEWFKMFCFEVVIQDDLLKLKHKKIMLTEPITLDKKDVLGKNPGS